MSFEALLFDLDDTLYPSTTGIWQAIGVRMDEFIVTNLGIDKQNVQQLRDNLWHEYGTTLRGLKIRYDIDELEFLDYVHDIPIENYLRNDEMLMRTLSLYDERKVIFTNANQGHAKRVIAALGLDGTFEQIIDILQISPYCKPFPEAYARAQELAQIQNPEECIVIDDAPRNLETAHRLGYFTIQVGTETRSPYADAAIFSLYDLLDVLPVTRGGQGQAG